MHIRTATYEDSSFILEWRNDDTTRQMSISQEKISFESHSKWYSKALSNPALEIYIAEIDGNPIGMCRLDLYDEGIEISINMAPSARGAGLGRKFISQVCDKHRGKPITARIKAENAASIKAFESAGFSKSGLYEGLLIYVLQQS